MVPAMAEGVEECLRRGLIARNVNRLICEDVALDGQCGEALECENVSHTEWRNS